MAGYYPISTNFKTQSQYDFEVIQCDEKVFFEWLVIKRLCFGNEKFYYQQERIIKEIGIKKSRLETIKGKFMDWGLIVTQEGWNNTTHYTVTDGFIESLLEKTLKPENKKYVIKEVLGLKFNESQKLTDMEMAEAKQFLKMINKEYNIRRKKYANESNESFEYSYTELPANESELRQLLLLRYYIDNDTVIINSFTSFADDMIKGKQERATSPIALFTKYDKDKGAFTKFDYHLSQFNSNYFIKK